jgi:hypothetical protein
MVTNIGSNSNLTICFFKRTLVLVSASAMTRKEQTDIMRKWLLILCTAVCVLGASGLVHAAIVSIDDAVFGPGAITRDTETNLDWLDLTLSTNYTWSQIASLTQTGSLFEGFVFADGSKIRQFWEDAGIDTTQFGQGLSASLYLPVSELIAFLGITYGLPGDPQIFSMGFSSTFEPGYENPAIYGLRVNETSGTASIFLNYNRDTDTSESYIGGYMYRPVPIPDAIWLMATGLIGILGLRKRIQR